MLTVEEYSKQSGKSRRQVFYDLQDNRLAAQKINGRTYIQIDPASSPHYLTPHERNRLVQDCKSKLSNEIMIHAAEPTSCIMEILAPMVRSYQAMGLSFKGNGPAPSSAWERKELQKYDVVGFDYKSVNRKQNDLSKLTRKSRSDKETYRSEKIKNVLEELILPLAAHVFLNVNRSKTNLRKTRDLLIDYAKTDERFYEVAAINPHTLYKCLKNEFMKLGLSQMHQYLNHYNLFFKGKAYVTGAFTDDIKFGDWILMDDNKRNIASAWTYNQYDKKLEQKQIKSWNAIESRTRKYLSFKNSTKEFKSNDAILILVQALQEFGCPKKGVMVDNGLAKSKEFQNFIARLNFALAEILGPESYQLGYKVAKPYHPTDKAPVEGSFAITKEEFDGEFHNFVGDNHKIEGVHKTNSLTPEQANYTFEEYDKKYATYIRGWYETRKRQRIIDGKKKEISIRDYFNECWTTFVSQPIPARAIRFALQEERSYVYKGRVELSVAGYTSDYIPTGFGMNSLPPSFIHRRFTILLNPTAPEEVDLYAAESFTDRLHGLTYNAGDFVATLRAVRSMGTEKQRAVAIHNSERQKQARKLAADAVQQSMPIDVSSRVNEAGKLEDAPKMMKKEIRSIIKEEQPLEHIAVEAKRRVEEKNHSFTINELDDIINSQSQPISKENKQ